MNVVLGVQNNLLDLHTVSINSEKLDLYHIVVAVVDRLIWYTSVHIAKLKEMRSGCELPISVIAPFLIQSFLCYIQTIIQYPIKNALHNCN